MQTVLAIDIGTSQIKCALIDSVGVVVQAKKFSTQFTSDIERWYQQLLREIVRFSTMEKKSIQAIIACGQAPSMVGLDRHGRIVPPVLFRDSIAQHMDAQRHSLQSQFLMGAQWYAQTYQQEFLKIAHWVPIVEYFVYRLCNVLCCMLPNARYHKYYWTPTALARSALDADRFPPFVYLGEKIGVLNTDSMRRMRVSKNISILSGGLDFIFALIGTNSIGESSICDRAGSSQGINIVSSTKITHPLFQSYPLLKRNQKNYAIIIHNSGDILRTMRATHLRRVRVLINAHTLDPLPLIPTVVTRGEFMIDTAVSARDRVNIILRIEAILHLMKFAIAIGCTANLNPHTINLSGGQTEYEQWNQLKADYLALPCAQFSTPHTELIGCAALGFYRLGKYSALDEAAATFAQRRTVYYPQSSHGARHAMRYRYFQRTFALRLPADQHNIR